MSSFHDWNEQMPDPSLDETTADSLLLGEVAPADAPPGYAGLAALARHVTMAAGAPELAAEPAVVELMVAASASADPQRMPIMRKALLARNLLTAKVAAIAVVGTFGLGSAAAAAAGVLPGQSHSDTRPLRAPISSVTSTGAPAAGTTTGSSTGGTLPTSGAGALFTPVPEETTPTSAVTVPEGTTEPTDPTTQPSEDTPGTTEATNPEDNGADSNQQDQPTVSTPPTGETETTEPPETQTPETQTPETQTPPTTEPSETESTTPSTSPTTEQPSTGSDGEQSSSGTSATPTTAPGSDG